MKHLYLPALIDWAQRSHLGAEAPAALSTACSKGHSWWCAMVSNRVWYTMCQHFLTTVSRRATYPHFFVCAYLGVVCQGGSTRNLAFR